MAENQVHFNFVGSQDLANKIEAYATEIGSSSSEAMRRLIEAGLEATGMDKLSTPIGRIVHEAIAETMDAVFSGIEDKIDGAILDLSQANGDVRDAAYANLALMSRVTGTDFEENLAQGEWIAMGADARTIGGGRG